MATPHLCAWKLHSMIIVHRLFLVVLKGYWLFWCQKISGNTINLFWSQVVNGLPIKDPPFFFPRSCDSIGCRSIDLQLGNWETEKLGGLMRFASIAMLKLLEGIYRISTWILQKQLEVFEPKKWDMDANSGVGFGKSHQHGKKMAQDSFMDLFSTYIHVCF